MEPFDTIGFDSYQDSAMGGAPGSGVLADQPETSTPWWEQDQLYTETPYESPEPPAYQQALLGENVQYGGPVEYDDQGEIVVDPKTKAKARANTIGDLLMGASMSLLNQDPRYVIQAGSEAGENYQKELNAARARRIARRTMEFNEVITKQEMEGRAQNLDDQRRAAHELDERAKQRIVAQKAIGEATKRTAAVIHQHLEEAEKTKEIIPYMEGDSKKTANVYRGKLDLVGAMFQAGDAVGASKLLLEIEAALPAYRREMIKAEIQAIQWGIEYGQEGAPKGMMLDPETGKYVYTEDVELDRKGKKARDAAAYGAANQSNAYAESLRNPPPQFSARDAASREEASLIFNKAQSVASEDQSEMSALDDQTKKDMRETFGAFGSGQEAVRKGLEFVDWYYGLAMKKHEEMSRDPRRAGMDTPPPPTKQDIIAQLRSRSGLISDMVDAFKKSASGQGPTSGNNSSGLIFPDPTSVGTSHTGTP